MFCTHFGFHNWTELSATVGVPIIEGLLYCNILTTTFNVNELYLNVVYRMNILHTVFHDLSHLKKPPSKPSQTFIIITLHFPATV